MIRVIIADDHTIFRQGFKGLLDSTGDISVVGEAGNGGDALRLISELKPDIAILDIAMPGLDGIEVTKEVMGKGIATKVIVLTMNDNAVFARRATDAGASGFVLKDNAFEDLLEAIKTVMSGGTFISPSIAAKMDSDLQDRKDEILTGRETEVLNLIASGLTNKQIAEKLFISFKTVDAHRTNIMQKLDIHNTAELVRYALKAKIV